MLAVAEKRYHWFPSGTETHGNGYLLSLSSLSFSRSLLAASVPSTGCLPLSLFYSLSPALSCSAASR